jgi:spermidine synthase
VPRSPGSAAAVLHLLFFLSGAAALVYQVTWVRSLGLVFGGSHLAVSTVLAVFMGGLALGGWSFGRRADRMPRPLRLYAALEFGIAGSAAGFFGLLHVYPHLYVPLARLGETNPLWLTLVRVLLGTAGMIVPTTLMGGTLPVLVRFASRRPGGLGGSLAVLYAINTLGAVAGTLAAGFVLLPWLGVTRTVAVAVTVNVAIGIAALLLPETRLPSAVAAPAVGAGGARSRPVAAGNGLVFRCVLIGIGISGFCALGYEVLWTRVLSMVVGTSVYSFTILLAAFLTGIAAGGRGEALLSRALPDRFQVGTAHAAAFAITQVLIGIAALMVTYALRDLPAYAVALQGLFASGGEEFRARQGASFVLAFAFMVVPAFFMGMAFPLAGAVQAAWRGRVGGAVGEVLAANTVGAILGAAASGFFLIRALGIERSLQSLAILNLAWGVVVLASLLRRGWRRPMVAVVALSGAAVLVVRAADPSWGRAWDERFFAIWRNNQREAFDSPERIRDALANTEILYFHEGANETISVVRPRGAQQAFIVNGRVEASTSRQDRQCQLTLGHLPMLAHPNPRRVFVLGTGTGMTLGATTLHPEAEAIVLAEIEAGVLPAARTFERWNHRALDHPKVRVVFNDGRNFLRTTRERFDVITADPIHPWSGGASYLYTAEYFRLAAARLNPGGVICQWLPIYELTPDDLRAVVRSFSAGFRHVMLWLTHYDAELLGSNDPIRLDLEAIERRIARSPIRDDLDSIDMGTARDFVEYFVAGSAGLAAFSRGGVLNTDDNLWLEFSSPKSQGVARVMGDNVAALAAVREPVDAYLRPGSAAPSGERAAAASLYDRAHALFLWGQAGSDEFGAVFEALRSRYPEFAPGRYLHGEVNDRLARQPRLLDRVPVRIVQPDGSSGWVEISVVGQRIGPQRGVLTVVDNQARVVYGERYLDAPAEALERELIETSGRVVQGLRAAGAGALAPEALRARIAELLD